MIYSGMAVICLDKKVEAKDLKSGDIVWIRNEYWVCLGRNQNNVVHYKKLGRSEYQDELRSTLEAPMILCNVIAMPKEGMVIDILYPARKTSQGFTKEPFKKRMRVELVAVNKFFACNDNKQDSPHEVFQLRPDGLYDITHGLNEIRVTYEHVEPEK